MPSTRLPPPARALSRRRSAPLQRSLAAALMIALAPVPSGAATIRVTTPDDGSGPDVTATCTLRQAIASMNAAALAGGCTHSAPDIAFGTDDTITFAASAVAAAQTPGTVTLRDPDGDTLTGGTLVVSAARLTIDAGEWRGSGAGQYADGVTIARAADAAATFGILRDDAAAGGALMLKGLALRNGNATDAACDGGPHGGGVCVPSADLVLVASTISGNSANALGGGIHSGSGALTVTDSRVHGNSAYRGGGIHAGSGTLTLTGSTVDGNYAMRGGGILSDSAASSLVGSTISGNSARRGGGIFAESGTQALTDSVVSANWAYYHGGGIYAANGTLTVSGSTLHANAARYSGGGIYALAGTLDLGNSTISGNTVYRTGGGILCHGTLALVHATVSQNTAGQTGGGIDGSGHGRIERSIVAGNAQASGDDVNLGGPWTGSGNLVEAANLDLGPLQDNGGPTPTMLPGAGSAALDAIAASDCGATVDQRGVARPQGAGCDIGAVEVVPDAIFADGFDPPAPRAGFRRP
ncbi:choice-of-anchor Q domain-containing protein [Dokdonella ginsengisoli]|uniref:Choice-of-anchor Q domain-containing protein n=1 Tax=Dokdonella ginsengisoli TaxID=363846 RepID=A0ABV9QZ06_9GAMM